MLSNEEKAKIKAEEEFRAKSAAMATRKARKRGIPWWGWVFIVVIGFGVLGQLINPTPSSRTSNSTSNQLQVGKPTTTPNQSNKPKPTPKPVAEKPNLELLDYKSVVGEFGNQTIKGRVRNNTDREYSYAQIEFNLYNKSNNQVGSALANINNLEPGGIWAFEAAMLQDDVATYKFKELTGF
jgi:hypothetical protein